MDSWICFQCRGFFFEKNINLREGSFEALIRHTSNIEASTRLVVGNMMKIKLTMMILRMTYLRPSLLLIKLILSTMSLYNLQQKSRHNVSDHNDNIY